MILFLVIGRDDCHKYDGFILDDLLISQPPVNKRDQVNAVEVCKEG